MGQSKLKHFPLNAPGITQVLASFYATIFRRYGGEAAQGYVLIVMTSALPSG